MKKHLIVAAVAAAVAVPAAAQVTVSGYVEAGVTSVETNSSRTRAVSNFVGTNTLTISGSEDLGGGLKASFTLSQEFNLSTGAETGSDSNNANTSTTDATTVPTFEESSIQVSGGFGAVKLGRFNAAIRDNGGNYRFFGDVGRVDGDFRTLNKELAQAVQYSSPTFAGVTVHAAYSNDGSRTPAAATPKTTAIGAFYKQGAINVGGGITKQDTNATDNAKLTTFGGSYDLGMAKVGYLYGKYELASSTVEREVNLFQVAVPLGGGLTVGAAYQAYDSTTANTDGSTHTLMATKALSKRTAINVAYASVKNTGSEGFAPASLVGATANKTNSGFGVSVSHKF